MARAQPPAREGRRRTAGILAASLALHAALLGALVVATPPHLPPESPQPPADLLVELAPATHSARPAPAPAPPPSRARQAVAAPDVASLPASPSPSSASPRAESVAPSAAGSSAGTAGSGADIGEGARAALRAMLACGRDRPGAPERQGCDARLALASRTAPRVDPIPAEKRAYYDRVVEAYAKVRDFQGTPGRVPVGPPGPQRGQVGFYVPGLGCAMKFGIPRGWKAYHDRPPHSLKLGPLPCFVTPPQALGTEESAVEAPASLRERTDDAKHAAEFDPPAPPRR